MSRPMLDLKTFVRDARGNAAVEFVLWLALLIVPLLSVVDVGAYVFQRMQLQIAGQAGAQYVWHMCDPNLGGVPAFNSAKCSNLSLAGVTSSVQATTLGTKVTVTGVKEGSACTKANNTLTWVGTPSIAIGTAPTPLANCPSSTGSTTPPGDYVTITVSYPYRPAFTGLSVGSLLTTPITHTSLIRMN